MFGSRERYRYDHYTWPEIREVVKRQPVVVLPIGSVEDHGPHLPLDTDHFLITAVCEEAARRIPEEMLLLPPVPYGFADHHLDFPGPITIRPAHLEAFVLDITTSVARHGFSKILLADGHGSNMPILELVARRTVLETKALCAAFIWPNLILEVLREIRESEYPGGLAHAGELETSVYLWLNSEAVQREQAVKDLHEHPSKFHWQDSTGGGPLRFMDWWSRISHTGTVGDPTVASAEKGQKCFEACVERLIALVREFRRWEIRPRVDHH
ncbi:MAG TPA: creatininase family protein [Armatimonadetes bacterium]|nr:creatininase family protein [Armatimonadota bacterium]